MTAQWSGSFDLLEIKCHKFIILSCWMVSVWILALWLKTCFGRSQWPLTTKLKMKNLKMFLTYLVYENGSDGWTDGWTTQKHSIAHHRLHATTKKWRESTRVNFRFYVKRLKRGQKEVHTHIHALPNCSPKGQWDLDQLMQMVHRKNTVNRLWNTYASVSRVFALLQSWFLINTHHLSSLVVSFPLDIEEKPKRMGRVDSCCPSAKR